MTLESNLGVMETFPINSIVVCAGGKFGTVVGYCLDQDDGIMLLVDLVTHYVAELSSVQKSVPYYITEVILWKKSFNYI